MKMKLISAARATAGLVAPLALVAATATSGQAATINGTDSANTLTGTMSPDTIYGKGGDDTIHGRGDVDYLYGGLGNDVLYGDAGWDNLYGSYGADRIYGGGGAYGDSVHAGPGNDQIWIYTEGTDRDYIDCGGGTDILYTHGAGVLPQTTGCESIRHF